MRANLERIVDELVTRRLRTYRVTRTGRVTAVHAGPPATVTVAGKTLRYESGKVFAAGDRVVFTTGRDPVVLFKLA